MSEKDKTVRFIFDADAGVRKMEEVVQATNKMGDAMDRNSQKNMNLIEKVKKSIDDFNQGVKSADSRIGGFFESLFKIGRLLFKIMVTVKFMQRVSQQGIFQKLFFGENGKLKLPTWGEVKNSTKDLQSAFNNVFEHSTFKGGEGQLIKNITATLRGEQGIGSIGKGVGTALKNDLNQAYPTIAKVTERVHATGKSWAESIRGSRLFSHSVRGANQNVSILRRLTLWFTERSPYWRLGQGVRYTGRAVGSVVNTLKSQNNMLGDMTGFLAKIGTGPLKFFALAFAISKVVHSLKKTVEVGLETEKSMMKFEIMLGSNAKAVEMYRKARQASLVSKYTPQEVAQAGSMMVAYGIEDPFKKGGGAGLEMKEDMTAMKAAMGMAAAGGMGLDHAVRALMRGEVALLDQYKHARDVYNKLIAKGVRLGTDDFRKQFIQGVAEVPEYMRASKIEAESVAGAWSTISGATQDMWVALSGAAESSDKTFSLWSSIRKILIDYAAASVKFAEFMEPILTEIGAVFGQVFEFIYNVYLLIQPIVGIVLAGVMKTIHVIARIINIVMWVLNKLVRIVRAVFLVTFERVAGFLMKIVNASEGSAGVVKDIVQFIDDMILRMKIFFLFLDIFLRDELELVRQFFDLISGIIHGMYTASKFLTPGGINEVILERAGKNQKTSDKAEAEYKKTGTLSEATRKELMEDQAKHSLGILKDIISAFKEPTVQKQVNTTTNNNKTINQRSNVIKQTNYITGNDQNTNLSGRPVQ